MAQMPQMRAVLAESGPCPFMALAGVSCPLLAQSGHFDGSSECPSGHRAELSQCLLLTQSGGTLPCPGLGGDNETARFTAPGVGVLVAGSRGSIALRQADRVSNLSAESGRCEFIKGLAIGCLASDL